MIKVSKNHSTSVPINDHKPPANFSGKYSLKPISKVLFDLSVHFKLNALILDLEERKISIEFKNGSLKQCLSDLYSTGRVRMYAGKSLAVFTRAEASHALLGKRVSKMEKLLAKRFDPPLSISSFNTSLFHVLDRVIDQTDLGLLLTNQLNSRLSLHLIDSQPFEVLFYVMHFYHLKITKQDQNLMLIPALK